MQETNVLVTVMDLSFTLRCIHLKNLWILFSSSFALITFCVLKTLPYTI